MISVMIDRTLFKSVSFCVRREISAFAHSYLWKNASLVISSADPRIRRRPVAGSTYRLSEK